MSKLKLISGLMLPALCSLASGAQAAITSQVTVGFQGMSSSAYYGKANLAPDASGNCIGSSCYYEGGVAFGTLYDSSPDGGGVHIHRAGTVGAFQLEYASDSSGIYFRAKDSTAFSLKSMEFRAPINGNNLVYGSNPTLDANGILTPTVGIEQTTAYLGPNEYWEILGFNTAINPNLDTGDGTNYANRVAYKTVSNGFDGNLLLDATFNNVDAIWIHYHGYTQFPIDGIAFTMLLDNVVLDAPVTAVPIPAAVWLFGSAMTGLVAFSRKKPAK